MSYAVVKFHCDNTYSEIPQSWLTDDKQYCFWPPNPRNTFQLMKREETPASTWNKFAVSVQSIHTTLQQARRKAEDSDCTSTESEGFRGKGKRKRKLKRSTSESTDSESGSIREDCSTPPPAFKKKTNEPVIIIQECETPGTALPNEFLEVVEDATLVSMDGLSEDETLINLATPSTSVGNEKYFHDRAIVTTSHSTPHILRKPSIQLEQSTIGKILSLCKSIQNSVMSIDSRLKRLEENQINKPMIVESYDIVSRGLPLDNLACMKEYENNLTNDEFKVTFVQYISAIGGRHAKDNITRILQRLFTNNFARQCSWLGLRNNIKICDLQSIKAVKDVVIKLHSIKQHEIEFVIKEWFRLSNLRYMREQKGK